MIYGREERAIVKREREGREERKRNGKRRVVEVGKSLCGVSVARKHRNLDRPRLSPLTPCQDEQVNSLRMISMSLQADAANSTFFAALTRFKHSSLIITSLMRFERRFSQIV